MQDPAGPKGSSTGLPAYQAPRPNLARTFPWPAGIRTPSMRSRRKFAPWSAARLPCGLVRVGLRQRPDDLCRRGVGGRVDGTRVGDTERRFCERLLLAIGCPEAIIS